MKWSKFAFVASVVVGGAPPHGGFVAAVRAGNGGFVAAGAGNGGFVAVRAEFSQLDLNLVQLFVKVVEGVLI